MYLFLDAQRCDLLRLYLDHVTLKLYCNKTGKAALVGGCFIERGDSGKHTLKLHHLCVLIFSNAVICTYNTQFAVGASF